MSRTYIARATISELKSRLREKAREPAPLTVRRLFKAVRKEVKDYLKKGGSLDALADVLQAEGLATVTAARLKLVFVPGSKSPPAKKGQTSKAIAKSKAPPPSDTEWLALELTPERFDRLKQAIRSVTQAHKQGLSLKEAISLMFDELSADLEQGYDWEDIQAWFSKDFNIDCTANSLRVTYQKVLAERRQGVSPEAVTSPESSLKAAEPVVETAQEAEAEAKQAPARAAQPLGNTRPKNKPTRPRKLPPSAAPEAVSDGFIGLED